MQPQRGETTSGMKLLTVSNKRRYLMPPARLHRGSLFAPLNPEVTKKSRLRVDGSSEECP